MPRPHRIEELRAAHALLLLQVLSRLSLCRELRTLLELHLAQPLAQRLLVPWEALRRIGTGLLAKPRRLGVPVPIG